MTAQKPRICVLGAGISGLSTAIQVQNLGLSNVTIVADSFLSETTSSAAAGLWVPHVLGETEEHLQKRWSDATFARLRELYMSAECAASGITRLSGYVLLRNIDPNNSYLNPFWKDTVGNFRHLTQDDLKQFPGHKQGIFFTTFLSESLVYIKYLQSKFVERGGKLVKMKVSSLEELVGMSDIIVNCSGAGAKDLLNDHKCESIRGQVMKVTAPWVKHFYIEGDGSPYLIPIINELVIGGTHQWNRTDMDVDEKDVEDIRREAFRLLPSLVKAKVTGHKVGLRPGRTSLRLEREDICVGTKKIPVIHNYGHGGSGFTLHWGCSLDAGQLALEAAAEISGKSKL